MSSSFWKRYKPIGDTWETLKFVEKFPTGSVRGPAIPVMPHRRPHGSVVKGEILPEDTIWQFPPTFTPEVREQPDPNCKWYRLEEIED